MKIINTSKKKIVAGVTVVALISGAGFGLANTNLGEQIRAWFGPKTEVAIEEGLAGAREYGEAQLPGLEEDLNKLMDGSSESINTTRDKETNRVSGEIDNVKESHMSDLDLMKQQLIEEVDLEFNNVFTDGYFEIKRLTELGEEYAISELTDLTGNTGSEAVNYVNEELDLARNKAVSDLDQAIKDAKKDLEIKLASQTEILERNLINFIDSHIRDLRKEVKKIAEELVEKQQTVIVTVAQEKEAEAMKALDDVVSGVNN